MFHWFKSLNSHQAVIVVYQNYQYVYNLMLFMSNLKDNKLLNFLNDTSNSSLSNSTNLFANY